MEDSACLTDAVDPCTSPCSAAHSSKATSLVKRAVSLIDACFAEPIPLARLAAESALSMSRFGVRFRKEVGMSPQQYVRLVRVTAAKRLLLLGLSPSVVATEVGFFDQSHLCRYFKRVTGTTPGEWLKVTAKHTQAHTLRHATTHSEKRSRKAMQRPVSFENK